MEVSLLQISDNLTVTRLIYKHSRARSTKLCSASVPYNSIVDNVERASLLNWYSTYPSAARHNVIKEKIVPGTGQWLLNSSFFHLWLISGSSGLLWLHASPSSMYWCCPTVSYRSALAGPLTHFIDLCAQHRLVVLVVDALDEFEAGFKISRDISAFVDSMISDLLRQKEASQDHNSSRDQE
ncbi:hypothetical protein MRB53_041438 [Persea americana]|nr:hypothetical protein MRB53_041438 [Persea americana]